MKSLIPYIETYQIDTSWPFIVFKIASM